MINRYQASVKCAVKIGAKRNTIVHLVVLAHTKRNNVAGINEIIAEGRFNTHSGEAAGRVIDLWHQLLKQTSSYKYILLCFNFDRLILSQRFVKQISLHVMNIACPFFLALNVLAPG